MYNKILSSSLPDERSPLFYDPSRRKRESRSVFISCAFLIIGILIIFYLYRLLIAYEPEVEGYECKKPKYDYDILALRWIPTFCINHQCINSTDAWQIHGLWPSWLHHGKKEGPEHCCPDWAFSENELKNILPQLTIDWPNQIPSRDKDSLWDHEWTKHGTCSTLSQSIDGMLNYFNTTLTLFHRYPIKSWLNEAGIKSTPAEGKYSYKLETVHETIETKINSTITINCFQTDEKIILLDTIYLCFKSPTMELTNCPTSDSCHSAQKVVLPSNPITTTIN